MFLSDSLVPLITPCFVGKENYKKDNSSAIKCKNRLNE